jgi:hypothetical protein
MASNDVRAQLHDQVYGALIDIIRRDQYPSATMMNMVEQGMEGHELQAYIEALLEKIENDRFPSIDLLKRVTRLV